MRKIVDDGGRLMHNTLGPFPGSVTQLQAPARDGHRINCLMYRIGQNDSHAPLVVWCHGGGFCLGNPDEDEIIFRMLCSDFGCTVISIEYRRAPEHPFPTPVNDCWDALRWVCLQHPPLLVIENILN